MSTEMVNSQDLVRLVRRNALFFVFLVVLGAVIGGAVSFRIPKKFKSKAVLNIQASYFRNPLVSTFISEVNDPAEQSSQRSSLLRQALSDSFLDALGDRYKVFQYPADHRLRAMERELFLNRIEYYSVSPTTFQIAVIANDATVSYQMTKEVLEQMIDTLIKERLRNLIVTRDAIHAHVQSLSLALQGVASPTASLKNELQRIESDIRTLTSQFSDKHPDVLRLKQRAEAVQRVLESYAQNKVGTEGNSLTGPNPAQEFASPNSTAPLRDVYEDLLKKLNYLSVVLEMERDRSNLPYLGIIQQPSIPTRPFFPEKRMFVAFGALGGAALAAILILYIELRRGAFLSPSFALQSVEMNFLGELPPLPQHQKVTLLEGPGAHAVRKSLPPAPSQV